MPLTISVDFDMDRERFVLMCDDGRMSPSPAGQRLFRAPPHPEIEFRHTTMEAAEIDARKLRTYLAQLTTKKLSKKKLQEFTE